MIGSPTPTASPTTPTINPSTVVPLTIPTIVGTVGNSATRGVTERSVPAIGDPAENAANVREFAIRDTSLASPEAPDTFFLTPSGEIQPLQGRP